MLSVLECRLVLAVGLQRADRLDCVRRLIRTIAKFRGIPDNQNLGVGLITGSVRSIQRRTTVGRDKHQTQGASRC